MKSHSRPRTRLASVFIVALSALAMVAMGAAAAQATGTIKGQFNQKYNTGGTQLDSCSTCHTASDDLNQYGKDLKTAGLDFVAIEPIDSDQDGFTNIEEIEARTFPGKGSSYPQPPPAGTAEGIPYLAQIVQEAANGLPVIGSGVGGEQGGITPEEQSDQAGEEVETATKGTTESCTKCHPEKKGEEHYFNVTPSGTADCWLCHTKHIACTACHRLGAGESVGHIVAERTNAFTGQDLTPVSDQIDAVIIEYAPEVNYVIADGGLILKDMPGDVSGVAGILMPIMEGEGSAGPLTKTIWRVDNTAHDQRLYKRIDDAQ
ncbi:MAG: hypothetical protein WDA27_04440 [Actinomycetota bacterium]